MADNTSAEAASAASSFPTLVPVLTMTLKIGYPIPIGSVSRGTPCTMVPLTGGKLLAEPGLGIELDGTLFGVGSDYMHYDPGGKHMRLDTKVVFRTLRDDRIYVRYQGIIEITPELSAILGGSVHSRSTDFGNQFIQVEFETGSEKYRDLETGVYVGSGRFLLEENLEGLSAEYKICRVSHQPNSPRDKRDHLDPASRNEAGAELSG